jgi:hypothetical protein
MRCILERAILGTDHDVAHQRQFGMPHRGPINDRNHRHFDIEHARHEPVGVPMNRVQKIGRDVMRYLAIERIAGLGTGSTELVAYARHNDNSIFAVGANLGECVDQLGLNGGSPAHRRATGVQGHLKNAVFALKFNF